MFQISRLKYLFRPGSDNLPAARVARLLGFFLFRDPIFTTSPTNITLLAFPSMVRYDHAVLRTCIAKSSRLWITFDGAGCTYHCPLCRISMSICKLSGVHSGLLSGVQQSRPSLAGMTFPSIREDA